MSGFQAAKDNKVTRQLSEIFKRCGEKIKDFFADDEKIERFLQVQEKKLETIPTAGTSLSYVPVLISMIRSYFTKEYTEVPVASIMSILVALGYLAWPKDVIPDIIPVLGYVDDAAVIAGCLALIETDLDDYRTWRKKQGYEFDDLPDYSKIKREAIKSRKVINSFLEWQKSQKEEIKEIIKEVEEEKSKEQQLPNSKKEELLEDHTPRFPNIDWWCDNCNAYLNTQKGFDDNLSSWTCTICGHTSPISEDCIIYEKEEEKFDNDNSSNETETLSVWDAAEIWASKGKDEDYMFGYTKEELEKALKD